MRDVSLVATVHECDATVYQRTLINSDTREADHSRTVAWKAVVDLPMSELEEPCRVTMCAM